MKAIEWFFLFISFSEKNHWKFIEFVSLHGTRSISSSRRAQYNSGEGNLYVLYIITRKEYFI
jgi:hypothetical protein